MKAVMKMAWRKRNNEKWRKNNGVKKAGANCGAICAARKMKKGVAAQHRRMAAAAKKERIMNEIEISAKVSAQ
jgi:hypothetical protein